MLFSTTVQIVGASTDYWRSRSSFSERTLLFSMTSAKRQAPKTVLKTHIDPKAGKTDGCVTALPPFLFGPRLAGHLFVEVV